MKGHRIGYIRVSSADQNTARQLEGIELDEIFEEKASGKNTERPALQQMITFARKGDTVFVHSMDRLARNASDLRSTVATLTAKGATVQFVKEGLTFTGDKNLVADLMLSVIGAFAEFERAQIRERQMEGIAIAKANKVYKGRKPALKPAQVIELKRQVDGGTPKAQVAKEFGISRESLYRYLRRD